MPKVKEARNRRPETSKPNWEDEKVGDGEGMASPSTQLLGVHGHGRVGIQALPKEAHPIPDAAVSYQPFKEFRSDEDGGLVSHPSEMGGLAFWVELSTEVGWQRFLLRQACCVVG